jgi:alcohol dehydrogenase (cytochrome c)
MPKNEGGTLSCDYLAVVAFMLERNGHPVGDRELTADERVLASLRLARPPRRPPPAEGSGARLHRRDEWHDTEGLRSDDTLVAATQRRDWLMESHDYSATRFSPLTQITSANVSQLRPVCAYQVGETGNFQTGPVVDRGTMYVTSTQPSPSTATCRPKWRHV